MGIEAIRWRGGVAFGLGGLDAGHEIFSAARDASADGTVVVGASEGPAGREAFVWDEQRGMRAVRDLLVREHRLDLAGWTLLEATAVSDDGRTIAGYGRNPDGRTEGWIARLPPAADRPPPVAEHRLTLGGLNEPLGVAIGGDGGFYVAEAGDGSILVLDPAGQPVRSIPLPGDVPSDGPSAGQGTRPAQLVAVAVTPEGEHLAAAPESWGAWKTPTLRNVARTAPYMHQGQLATLRRVVEHYSTLRGAAFGAHHRETVLRPLGLSEREIGDLVAFLESLTDEAIDPALMRRPPPADR